MLWSIDENKVREVLSSSGEKSYVVSTSDLPMQSGNYTPSYPATSEAFGTVYAAPVLVTAETKERFISLRREIEEAGFPLSNSDDLIREIDEMRGKR